MISDKTSIFISLSKVEKWIESQNYMGYEPFDGLSSKFRFLTFKNLLLDRILLQLIRQCPLNLRPFIGVEPLESTIARGYMAWGYCHMFRLTGIETYKKKIESCLEWLIDNKSQHYEEFSWGKHFDFASRGGLYKAFEPILIWTALIGHAFIEAYELFNNQQFLRVSESICDWILKLPRHKTDSGFCLGYHNHDEAGTIHNSNMIGAALLARTAKYAQTPEYMDTARSAMEFSCTRQLADGAWLYGEAPKNHWIDNFHTGYNLDGLKYFIDYSGDRQYQKIMLKGLEYYKNNFFEADGAPKYYNNRKYPIDSQCASQGIDTLANFGDLDDESLSMSSRVANWTIRNMQDPTGFFYYRMYPSGIKAKTPMIHWAQASTYKALTLLLLRYSERNQ
jgi:hypothetical protein